MDMSDETGTTALMYATAYGRNDCVIELLRAGANPRLMDDYGRTFIHHALIKENSQLFKDIHRFYVEEADHDRVQEMLDEALHIYIWSRSMNVCWDGLRVLLELGARPRWITPKGNTLFHAVRHAQQTFVLLEYCSPLLNNIQNTAGHTPLMIISQFLDVELTRRLISAGLSIQERDHHGWSVLECVFQASSFHFYRIYRNRGTGSYWPAAFRIASDLLEAGADFSASGVCQCFCSSHGCNTLHFFFRGIHSQSRRKGNLYHIPWLVELFLLLRGHQKKGLRTFVRSLVRRQRFDEIGLSHTCCLASGSSRSFLERRRLSAWDLEHDSTPEISHQDFGELRDEQEQLIDELEQYCETDPEDWEHALIRTLARRVVFIERGSEDFVVGASLRRTRQKNSERKQRVGSSNLPSHCDSADQVVDLRFY